MSEARSMTSRAPPDISSTTANAMMPIVAANACGDDCNVLHGEDGENK
ncbi:hypothetical protein [Rhodococcus zopfii]|nr:hypothetical protein [Rhodococcus zopfii]